VIKLRNIRHAAPWEIELEFSDSTHGRFDGKAYLGSHDGPQLVALRHANFFAQQ
jgi:hypothetical protein